MHASLDREMGLLDVQWPPERSSLTQSYQLAKRRVQDEEPRSVISTRNSAALLEARDFLSKLDVADRTQAVVFAWRHGLVRPD